MSRETEFHEAMLDIYKRAQRECRYTPTRFLQMVSEQGGLQAANMEKKSGIPTSDVGSILFRILTMPKCHSESDHRQRATG